MEVEQINNKSGAGSNSGSKSRKAQVLTERDFEALLWISKHGLMTIEQLYRAVWKRSGQTQIRYTYDRAKFLKESNFISEVTTPFSKKSYFELTKLGVQTASQITAQGMIPTAKIPQSEIMHADTLTELKLFVLESGKAKSWVTDRELYLDETFPKERFSSKAAFPDALWVTQTGTKVAVEYERTQKSKLRIESKIAAYNIELLRTDAAISRVLWVVQENLEKLFIQATKNYQNQHVRTIRSFNEELKGN